MGTHKSPKRKSIRRKSTRRKSTHRRSTRKRNTRKKNTLKSKCKVRKLSGIKSDLKIKSWEPCYGVIGSRQSFINTRGLPDFSHILCVLAAKRPVATVHYSEGHIRDNPEAPRIFNEIMDLIKDCGMGIIKAYDKNVEQDFLTIFNPSHTLDALILAYIVLVNPQLKLKPYLIGKLLGYYESRIKAFYKKIGKKITEFKTDKAEFSKLINQITHSNHFISFVRRLKNNNLIKIYN